MKPSSVYYTLYVNNLLLRVFLYPIPLDTVENEPQELYFLFCFVKIPLQGVPKKFVYMKGKHFLGHLVYSAIHNKIQMISSSINQKQV